MKNVNTSFTEPEFTPVCRFGGPLPCPGDDDGIDPTITVITILTTILPDTGQVL